MTLIIDTDHKTILFSGCNMSDAVHFARLHEFDGYTVKKDLPEYRVIYGQSVGETKEFIRNDLGGEYLESELVQSNATVSHVDAHLYTEIDGYGYCFAKGHKSESIVEFNTSVTEHNQTEFDNLIGIIEKKRRGKPVRQHKIWDSAVNTLHSDTTKTE